MIAMLVYATIVDQPAKALLAAAHSYTERRQVDRFAEPNLLMMKGGEPFRIETAFHNGDVADGVNIDASYTYDEGTLRLSFIPGDMPHAIIDGTPRAKVGFFSTSRKRLPGYVGQNVFGARVAVYSHIDTDDGVALLKFPIGELNPFGRNDSSLPKDTYWVVIPITGRKAANLAIAARLVIEGTLQPLPSGKSADCKVDHYFPRADAPGDIISERCWVGASVDRISITDGAEVLKEWSRNR